MKKIVLSALAVAAGTILTAVAAGSIKRQGGVGPTVDKLKESKFGSGVSAAFDKVKGSEFVANATDTLTKLRDQVVSNDDFVGEHVDTKAKAA
jgi:hypothetical protein